MKPFDYNKAQYDVTLLATGEVVRCWPNANVWHAMDGTGRIFQWGELEGVVEITDSTD